MVVGVAAVAADRSRGEGGALRILLESHCVKFVPINNKVAANGIPKNHFASPFGGNKRDSNHSNNNAVTAYSSTFIKWLTLGFNPRIPYSMANVMSERGL